MADNFLEYHYEEYEKRKALWLSKKKNARVPKRTLKVEKPEDETL